MYPRSYREFVKYLGKTLGGTTMKKTLILGAVMGLLLLQTAFAYNYDIHGTWETRRGTATMDRHVTGQPGEGRNLNSNWHRDGEYLGNVQRDIQWSRDGDCVKRTSDIHINGANGYTGHHTRNGQWGCC